MPAEPLARVLRSGLEEAVHLGHVAVCDARGRLLAWSGDPATVTFIRSCAKPVQAAVSLAAIGDLALTDREVAIMCASHDGTPAHLRQVRSLLRRAAVGDEALRTPAARPLDPDAAARVRTPAPVFHNCSGKHAGMLLACSRAGWRHATYPSRAHPLQRRVLDAMRGLSGEEPVLGVDGCGLPVHGMPLRAIATVFARLGDPDAQGALAPHVDRAMRAMRAEPALVGGDRRDDTLVMRAAPGIVMKEGAEAIDCAVALEPGIGVAVKVADGGFRAAGPATVAVLAELGLVSPSARRRLRPVERPAVRGGGARVGEVEPVVRLRTR